MSKQVVRAGQTYLAKSSDESLRKDLAEAATFTGVGGLVLWGLAGLLPFVTLPMLLVLAAVLGILGYAKR